jgi:hypothetical protein
MFVVVVSSMRSINGGAFPSVYFFVDYALKNDKLTSKLNLIPYLYLE